MAGRSTGFRVALTLRFTFLFKDREREEMFSLFFSSSSLVRPADLFRSERFGRVHLSRRDGKVASKAGGD